MNIFYLDNTPSECAKMHCDKHCIKMILEYAQLLSTAHRVIDGIQFIDNSSGRKIKRWTLSDSKLDESLYKATHINHPSAVWVRQSMENYKWLYELFVNLCNEYTHRYGKTHATEIKLIQLLSNVPKNISDKPFFQPPQAMPDNCKDLDSIIAYRNYYLKEKGSMLKFTKRNVPYWIN